MILLSPEHVCEILWGVLHQGTSLQATTGWTRQAKELAWKVPADEAAEWASKWLEIVSAAKNKQEKHTGTRNIAKPGFVLAACWIGAGSDSWRREPPSVVPGTEPSFVFKQIGSHAVNIWLLLAKLSHKTLNTDCLSGQKEQDLFIYLLLVYLVLVTRNIGSRSHVARQYSCLLFSSRLISLTQLHTKSYLWCTILLT